MEFNVEARFSPTGNNAAEEAIKQFVTGARFGCSTTCPKTPQLGPDLQFGRDCQGQLSEALFRATTRTGKAAASPLG